MLVWFVRPMTQFFDLKRQSYKGKNFDGVFSAFIISSRECHHKDFVQYLSRCLKTAPSFADEFVFKTTLLLIKHSILFD